MSEYIDKAGWRVAVSKVEDGNTHFFPAGGGFGYCMPTEKFDAEFKPAPARVMRRGTVTADFLGPNDNKPSPALPCWSDGSLWNGWGMPSFDRETVDKLIELDVGPLRWEGDKVVARMGDDPGDDEVYDPTTAPDGTTIWPVGAGSWCWDQVRFKKTYNHQFSVAFTVISENDGEHVTADELHDGLAARLRDLKNNHGEIVEACGAPDDTSVEDGE